MSGATIVIGIVFAFFGWIMLDVVTGFGLTRHTWCRLLGHRWDRPDSVFGKACMRCVYCPHLEELERRFGKLP